MAEGSNQKKQDLPGETKTSVLFTQQTHLTQDCIQTCKQPTIFLTEQTAALQIAF